MIDNLTTYSDDHDLDAGWEPRVALDFAIRKFITGLRMQPVEKPILLFLPRGAPGVLLAAFLGSISIGDRKTVCLIEDETLALAFDDSPMPDRVRKTTRLVIGDLKSLAKTDRDCYGGCVVLSYGCDMPPPRADRQHCMYLDDKALFITQLCGWNAHIVYLDQPFRDIPDDVLETMIDSEKTRRLVCELSVSRDISILGSRLRTCGRRVTLVSASLAGSNRSAGSCFYLRIFRASGKGSRRLACQDVQAAIFETEVSAIQFYKGEEFGLAPDESPCCFMKRPQYDEWSDHLPNQSKVRL
jgi:hypothetical protein